MWFINATLQSIEVSESYISHQSLIVHVTHILGSVWAHHCCAAWSEGVIQADDYSLQYVDKAVFKGLGDVSISYTMPLMIHVHDAWSQKIVSG